MEAQITNLNKELFQITLSRIIRVINCNYFEGFYKKELLGLNVMHQGNLPELGFNAQDKPLPYMAETGRHVNIFGYMAGNKPTNRRETRQSQRLDLSSVSQTQAGRDMSMMTIRKMPEISVNKDATLKRNQSEAKPQAKNGPQIEKSKSEMPSQQLLL